MESSRRTWRKETRYYTKHVMQQGDTDICRMCHQQPETVEHIMTGCTALAADQYLERHNKVAAENSIDTQGKHWYQHKPDRVIDNEAVTILRDSPIQTDRHIPCNKPDIVIREKTSNKCLMVDVAIPSDYNIQKTTTEKISNYIDLQTECQRMWNKTVEVIPVIVGATGVVEERLKTDLREA